MPKSELIAGLDLGTTKICAIVGQITDSGEMEILGIGTSPSTGLRKGVVVNIDQTVNAVQKAIEAAESMAGCEIRTVYAGIAGSHIKSLNSHGVVAVNGGEVTPRVVERALEAAKAIVIPQDREVIHTLPQEYIVDDQRGIIDPLGMSGVRLEVRVHIVTGAVSSAQNIIRCCHKSNLDVTNIVLESLASAKAVLTDEEREIGVALVDLGGGTCDIAVIANEAIKHTSVLPLGGQNLTNDIAVVMNTPLAAAEKIKIKYGCALADMVRPDEYIEVPSVGGRDPRRVQRQVLAEICQPRMEEILSLVDQELENSGFKKTIGAGVVLTGGAALLEGCQELGESIFGLPTRIGYPHGVTGLKDMVNSPKYATAAGLLRFGAEMEGSEQRFMRSEKTGFFASILKRMKEWFADIS